MAFIVPTIYRAVDQMSGVQARIGAGMNSLALHATRMQRTFNSLTPSFSAATNNMLQLAKGAVTASAAIGSIAFSGKSLLDYETAVQSFRTIVSELNDTEFAKFKTQIADVAFATKKSTIDVAQSFEKIAGLNAKFAETAQGLGLVSSASITLAKASRMELGPAAESMVGIMNQFSFGVEQANRTINALAAGQAVGAASIQQTADALTNFGATAAGANVTIEQSIALIQTMAKFGQVGENAGHRLRSALIKVQEAGVGYKSGKFQIDEALSSLKKQYDAIGSAAAKDAFLTNTFGLEQITAGRILLSNIDIYKEFTNQVTGTQEAFKAAEINSNTLSNRVTELKNKWVNIITTANTVGGAMNFITGAVRFLTNHMETLVSLAGPILGFFAAWKAYILLANAVLKVNTALLAANNFILGIATVINGKYATSCFATIAGMNGMATASFFLETGLIGTIGILGAAAIAISVLALEFNKGYDSSVNYVEQLKKTKDGVYEIAKPLTDAQIKLQLFNKEMESFRELQNYEASIKFREKKGGLDAASTIFDPIFHPVLYAKYRNQTMGGLMPLIAPQQDASTDSTGTDSTQTYNRNNDNRTTKVIEHRHIVELKQNGQTVAVIDTNNLMPAIGSTTA